MVWHVHDKNDKRPLPICESKTVITLFKEELGRRIMKEFCTLKAKTMFENYSDCLFNDKIILKSQQRFKRDHSKVYTEEVNKIALNSNDEKRLQTFNVIETYPYGTNAFKKCESEMMAVKNLIC